jgi:hypothetical protein
MERTLVIKLPDTTYSALEQQAETKGLSASDLAARSLERQYRSQVDPKSKAEARERFERHFGSVHLGRATGADNERIDADLAREYADDHESE